MEPRVFAAWNANHFGCAHFRSNERIFLLLRQLLKANAAVVLRFRLAFLLESDMIRAVCRKAVAEFEADSFLHRTARVVRPFAGSNVATKVRVALTTKIADQRFYSSRLLKDVLDQEVLNAITFFTSLK